MVRLLLGYINSLEGRWSDPEERERQSTPTGNERNNGPT
jgi:hypothetical protein